MIKLHPLFAPAIALTAVACGARFTAHGHDDGTASGAAGEASGGFTHSAGSSSVGDAGEPEVGGSSAGAAPSAGAAGAVTGTAGTTSGMGGSTGGRGGWGNGGWGNWGNVGGGGSGNGGAAGADCVSLGEQYQAAVEKARVCGKGSTDQCSASSSAEPVGGCGCPVLINVKGAATEAAKRAYQAYQKAGCVHTGPICDIFCPPVMSASCEPSSSGNDYVCTAGGLLK